MTWLSSWIRFVDSALMNVFIFFSLLLLSNLLLFIFYPFVANRLMCHRCHWKADPVVKPLSSVELSSCCCCCCRWHWFWLIASSSWNVFLSFSPTRNMFWEPCALLRNRPNWIRECRAFHTDCGSENRPRGDYYTSAQYLFYFFLFLPVWFLSFRVDD